MVGRLIGLAALCAAATWMYSAAAQTYLPPPSQPYPANSRAPAQYPAPAPDFDNLDDDATPPGAVPQDGRTGAIRSPGPILSPDDPRYAHAVPQGTPPQGPILSPNDPRYGQPPGPPNVIYSDRAPGGAPQGAPVYEGGPRPPQGVGEQAAVDPRAPAEPAAAVAGAGRP